MNDVLSWLETSKEAVLDTLAETMAYLPSLVMALLVLAAGWFIGRLVRALVRRIAYRANRVLHRVFRHGTMSGLHVSSATAAVLGEITFGIILFLSLTIAARVAGFAVIATWLDQIVAHLPNLFVGAVIVVTGYFLSILVREQVASTARATHATHSALMGTLAQAAVLVTTLIIGLDQIGIDVSFLAALFAVTAGAIFVGFSISFGLGAKSYVSNLIGARNARRDLKPGYRVRVSGKEGAILEVTQTHVVLDTEDGRWNVPAKLFDEEGVLILVPREDGEKRDA